MNGMSFREYLSLCHGFDFEAVAFEKMLLIMKHIANTLLKQLTLDH